MKRFVKRLTLVIAILTTACIVLIIGSFFLFHSPMMQRAIEKSLHKYILSKTDGYVNVEGLHLSFPSEIRIDHLTLSNEQHNLAVLKGVDLDISLWLLLFSEVKLSNLDIDSIHWLKTPPKNQSVKKEPLSEQLKSIQWPNLPVGIKVAHLKIGTLEIPGVEDRVSIEGAAAIKKLGGDINLSLKADSKTYGALDIICHGKSSNQQVYLQAKYIPTSLLCEQVKELHFEAKTSFNLSDLHHEAIEARNAFKLSLKGHGLFEHNNDSINANFRSRLSLGQMGFLKIDQMELESDLIDLKLNGSVGPQSAHAKQSLIDIYSVEQPLSIDSTFKITPKRTFLSLTNPLNGSFKGTFSKTSLEGGVSLDTVYKSLPIDLSSSIHWNLSELLELANISIESRESLIGGSLSFDLSTKDIMGSLDGSLLNFPFSSVTDYPFRSDADFKVNFDKGETAHIECNLQNTSLPYAKAFKGEIKGSILNYLSKPNAAIDAQFTNVFVHDVGAKSLLVSLSLTDLSIPFYLKVNGMDNSPFTVDIDGTLDREGKFLTIDTLRGDLYELPISSTQAITIKHDNGAFDITPLQIFIGQGDCKAEGSYSSQSGLNWSLDFYQLPIKPLQYLKNFDFIEGVVTGKSEGVLSKDKAEGSCDLTIAQLLFHPEMQAEELPLKGALTAQLDSDKLELEGTFSGVGATPSTCSINIPLKESPSPIGITIDMNGDVSGKLDAEGTIQPIAKLILSEQDLLVGNWKGNFSLYGSLRKPHLKGSGAFSKGFYENLSTGLSLKDIEFTITADDQAFHLNKGTANCGKKGSIAFDGHIDLSKKSMLDFALELNNTPILDIQEGSAIASGNLSLKGSIEDPVISGKVTLNQLELLIPDEVTDTLPQIEVSYVYPQPEPIELKQDTQIPIRLNVDVNIGNNSYVRGRGLNSNWKGDVKIKGKIEKPVVVGTFQLIRGEFAFSSTTFNLTDGKLQFREIGQDTGFLALKGESKIQDVNVYANLQGPISGPKLAFTSSPSYPETEILSLILFGSTSQDISPFQAIQVTQAVLQLSKGYSNLDIINRIRRNVGLDQLSITSMDEDPSNLEVHVGKYLSQNIYVSLAKSISANTNLISASIELYNAFTFGIEHIETYETQLIKNRIQAGWKHNY